ncbi:MAG: RluA family pseudouridine synthase [Rhodospirillales bacterium]
MTDSERRGGVTTVTVAADDEGLRVDRWFKRHYPAISHGRLEKWLRLGHIRIDGRRAKAGDRVVAGCTVRVPPQPSAPGEAASLGAAAPPASQPVAGQRITFGDNEAAALQARVLRIDPLLIVLDKPAGLAVQGGSKVARHLDAMLDALAFGGERPRLVHRLDRDTSGVLVLARSAAAARMLTAAFRGKSVRKLYWAVVAGVPVPAEGRVALPLAKAGGAGGEKMIVDELQGQTAITDYRVVDHAGRRAAWLALEPITGRTHQLRAHMAALGTPILGDGKYGGAPAFLAGGDVAQRVHLHARTIVLPHPQTPLLTVSAPLPPHLLATFRFFGFDEHQPEAGLSPLASSAGAGRLRHRRSPRTRRP